MKMEQADVRVGSQQVDDDGHFCSVQRGALSTLCKKWIPWLNLPSFFGFWSEELTRTCVVLFTFTKREVKWLCSHHQSFILRAITHHHYSAKKHQHRSSSCRDVALFLFFAMLLLLVFFYGSWQTTSFNGQWTHAIVVWNGPCGRLVRVRSCLWTRNTDIEPLTKPTCYRPALEKMHWTATGAESEILEFQGLPGLNNCITSIT